VSKILFSVSRCGECIVVSATSNDHLAIMVKRARTKSRSKRSYKKAKGILAPQRSMPLRPEQTLTMKYSSVQRLNSAVINQVENVYSANSIFDPDVTNVGHQPMLFDQMAAMYLRYKVTHSRMTVYGCNSAIITTSGKPTMLSIAVNDSSSVLASDDTPYETPFTWTAMTSAADGGQPVCKIVTPWIDIAAFKGWRMSRDQDYAALCTASPSIQLYYHLVAERVEGSTVDIQTRVIIEYKVLFYDPRQVAES